MKRDLDYFAEFLDNPAGLDRAEFWAKLAEWKELVRLNDGEYDLDCDEMQDKIEVVCKTFTDYRDEGRAELAEIERLYDVTPESDKEGYIAVSRRFNKFMKTYQLEFEFTDEQIAESENKLEAYRKALIRCRISRRIAEESRIVAEDSLKEFDEAIAKVYQGKGKPPVFTSLKARKKYSGN